MGALRSCTTNSRVRNDGTTYAMKVAAKMALAAGKRCNIQIKVSTILCRWYKIPLYFTSVALREPLGSNLLRENHT